MAVVEAEPADGGARGGRKRSTAARRRTELIEAAAREFARGGLHGTPVERIARRVGVAQPYVFSLFANKRALFLAAVERGFDRVEGLFTKASEDWRAGRGPEGCEDALEAMGCAYSEMLARERDYLLLQLQSYAACGEDDVRETVRRRYAQMVNLVARLSAADPDRLDNFFRTGMALNVAAAMQVEDIAVECDWVQRELLREDSGDPAQAAAGEPATGRADSD